MSAISIEKLTKVYSSGVQALHGLDLDVGDGEFVVLVGPSGCGKTTALRMVAGLETITDGTVRFGDQVVNDVSPRQRDVAMAERDRRVRSAALALGLSELLNRKPEQLSGGQRQRVAMGRAIVREPSVFLMDEPLSNLDAKLRVRMRSEVLRVHKAIGAATLYVTHDQVEAMTMGDRVAVLNAGVLQQYAAPRELYDHPANLFVAEFIGSPEMNIYEASVAEDKLLIGSQRLSLGPAGAALAPYRGRTVIAGVRPEDLELGRTGCSPGIRTTASPGSAPGPRFAPGNGSRSASTPNECTSSIPAPAPRSADTGPSGA